jgi:hypothetical protein
MDRYVMRHSELGGPALIPESSMPLHLAKGWLRVSGPISEQAMDQVRLADYADAPDLACAGEENSSPAQAADAPESDQPEPAPAKTVKEKC